MVGLRGQEKRRYVAAMFSRISRRYDLMNGLMTFGMDSRWRRKAAKRALEGLEGPVLDVATGTGDLALELERTAGAGEVVGMDLLQPMVSRAVVKGSRGRRQRRVSFAMGDALSLPFQDDSFACVTSAFSLRNIPDLEQSLREMARVVRPGDGCFRWRRCQWKGAAASAGEVVLPTGSSVGGALVTMDMAAYTYLPKSVEGFVSPEELEGMFARVGLEDVGGESMGFGAVHLHWGRKN